MYGYYFCEFFGPSAGPREIGKKGRKCDRGDQLEGFHQVPNQLKKKSNVFIQNGRKSNFVLTGAFLRRSKKRGPTAKHTVS